MFLLDTSAISEFERAKINPGFEAWFATVDWDDLHISSLSIAEIWNGILLRPHGKKRRELEAWFDLLCDRFEHTTHSVDKPVAISYAAIQAENGPLPVLDTLIAATAIVHRLTLVTRNTKDFARTGVRVLDPWT